MDISNLKAHMSTDLFTQVEAALKDVDGLSIIPTNDGSWLPKSRLDDEIAKQKTLKATIGTLTQQLDEAKKTGENAATLQATVDSLKQQVADRDATITGLKRSGKIRDALVAAKVRDASVVERLLDTSKLGEDDKGNLTGLEDQIKSLRENSSYLFNEEDGGGRRAGFPGGKNPDTGNTNRANSAMNDAIRAALGVAAN